MKKMLEVEVWQMSEGLYFAGLIDADRNKCTGETTHSIEEAVGIVMRKYGDKQYKKSYTDDWIKPSVQQIKKKPRKKKIPSKFPALEDF